MGGKGIRGFWICHTGIFWNLQDFFFFALWKYFCRQITLGLKLQLSQLSACQKLFWPTMKIFFLVVFWSGRSGGWQLPERRAPPRQHDGSLWTCGGRWEASATAWWRWRRCSTPLSWPPGAILPAEALCVGRKVQVEAAAVVCVGAPSINVGVCSPSHGTTKSYDMSVDFVD